jgi:hypothetical protein
MSAEAAKALVDSLNPIIDPDKDLHLLDTLSIRRLTLDDDLLVVEGEVRIPVKPELKPEDGKR